ncbi:MAG: hypothetical protein JXQ83_15045 [Candidatus Glassbacteria bacterium]|nr:hypothetical protein [Candidatus Glassbacteria bacterium]
MSDYLDDFLAYISTTAGFLLFVAVISLAYCSIWFLFLFEEKSRLKKGAKKPEKEKEHEENGEPPRQKRKQPATSG